MGTKVFRFQNSALLLLSTSLFFNTGCGGRSLASRTVGNDTFIIGGSSNLPITLPAPTPTSPITPTNPTGAQSPIIQSRVGTIGAHAVTVQVQVNNVLRVRFTPGVQDQAVAGGNFEPQYSKLGVYVGAGSNSQATEMLNNGYARGGTPQYSSIIDLGSSFNHSCSANDPTCRQTVTITVDRPNYDYWCMNWGTGCDYVEVYSTHPWHGTLEIQTDDTQALPAVPNF